MESENEPNSSVSSMSIRERILLLYESERFTRGTVWAVILVIMIGGVFYSAVLGSSLRFPDEIDHYTLGRNLVDKGIYSLDGDSPTAYRPAGYPVLIAAVIWLGGDVLAARLLNFLLLAGCVYLAAEIVRRLAPHQASAIAALLVLGYPVLFYTASTLYSQTLGAFLLLLLFHVVPDSGLSWGKAVGLGTIGGALVLTIPTLVVVPALIGVWLIWSSGSRVTVNVVLMLAICLVVLLPWTIRNYIVFDSVLFGSSNSGFNLLLGNSENASPNKGVLTDISSYQPESVMAEIELDKHYQDAAFDWIQANKSEAIKLYILKFMNYFNYRNELATSAEASALRDLVQFITYTPMLVAALCRLILVRIYPLKRYEVLTYATYIAAAIVMAVFVTRIRYRLPLDFLLIIVVASFFAFMIHRWIKGPVAHTEN